MKKRSIWLFVAVLSMGTFWGCKDEGPHLSDVVLFTATINNSNTQPRSNSSAQGAASLEYNKKTKTLTWNVTYSGVTPTVAHIHSAVPAWGNGPVEVPFNNVQTSPITGSAQLSQEQENKLIFGNMYINIHSATYPMGEIRGQILLKADN